tara:strand:- start:1160 stop:1420 length:261 start_codon:yes stop_codon:yes gene_type:complete
MKTDLEKFQEIVADINTIIFGKEDILEVALEYRRRAQNQEKKLYDLQNKIKSWDEIVNTHKDKPKPKKKRGRGRPKGSKNKKSKWL